MPEETMVQEPMQENSQQTETVQDSQQASQETTQAEATQQQPAYLTREEADKMFQAVVADIKNTISGMLQPQPLQYQMQQPAAQPAMQQNANFPSYEEFLQAIQDPRKIYDIFNSLREQQLRIQQIAQNSVEQFKREMEEQRLADQYYTWLVGQIEAATKPYEVYKNPKALDLLKARIAAEAMSNRGQFNKINFPGLAKEVSELISSGRQSGNGQQQRAVTPQAGAPTTGAQANSARTIDEFERGLDNLFRTGG